MTPKKIVPYSITTKVKRDQSWLAYSVNCYTNSKSTDVYSRQLAISTHIVMALNETLREDVSNED